MTKTLPKDLDEAAKMAAYKVAARPDKPKLFPLEEAALDKAMTSRMTGGDPRLDAEFDRFDVDMVLSSVRRERGVPYPVPRFAIFDLFREDATCRVAFRYRTTLLHSDTPAPNTTGGLYTKVVDIMHAANNRRLRLRYCAWWAALVLASAGLGLFAWSFESWIDQRPFLMAITVGLSAAASGIGGLIAFVWLISGVTSKPTGRNDIVFEGEEKITTAFSGVLPRGTRDVVEGLRRRLGPQAGFFLLCEVAPGGWVREWTEGSRVPMLADPLVLVRRDDAWYLVDKFDLTPAEEHVSREMTWRGDRGRPGKEA